MSTLDEFSLASLPDKQLVSSPSKPPTFARWRVANGGVDVDVLLQWHSDLPQLPNNQEFDYFLETKWLGKGRFE